MGVASAPNGKIYAVSGANTGTYPFVDEYDPASDSWTIRSSIPTPRYYFGLAAAGNGKLYAIGGFDTRSYLGTTEEYTPPSR